MLQSGRGTKKKTEEIAGVGSIGKIDQETQTDEVNTTNCCRGVESIRRMDCDSEINKVNKE
jgi:hypothetical protein